MKQFPHTFVAIDLETTGLDPQKDTIIEIAAIRYTLAHNGTNFYIATSEEHTTLVSPGISISKEVELITHITNEMLAHKKTWDKIQDSVRAFFIDDDIIVGHNVFFDISMLQTHGIDLTKHQIIDTFELAQIFSQNIESLNLGFLADAYQLPKNGVEHRALTDTRISQELFLWYLQKIQTFSKKEAAIWHKILETYPHTFFHILQDICQVPNKNTNFWNSWEQTFLENNPSKTPFFTNTTTKKEMNGWILQGNPDEIAKIVETFLGKHKNIQIIVENSEEAASLQSQLTQYHIETHIVHDPEEWIFPSALFESIRLKIPISRKQFVCLATLCFWLLQTKTGLLSEIKFYNNDEDFIKPFRLQSDESNIFIANIPTTSCAIFPMNTHIPSKNIPTIYHHLPLLENTFRKRLTQEIHFSDIIAACEHLPGDHTNLLNGIRLLESWYQQFRAPHNLDEPKDFYPEIQCISQDHLWHTDPIWVGLIVKKIRTQFLASLDILANTTLSRFETIALQTLKNQLHACFQLHAIKNTTHQIFLSFDQQDTALFLIPQKLPGDVLHTISAYTSAAAPQKILTDFLQLQFKNIPQATTLSSPPLLPLHTIKNEQWIFRHDHKKTIILTTSKKHVLEIGIQLQQQVKIPIFIQGISGGKAKITTLYSQADEAILVGLIDSWKHALAVLKSSDTVCIAKVPFDPPVDKYFIAKTQSISNNFERYSQPLALIKLNMLIGTIHAINTNIHIYCTDDRLSKKVWGKFIRDHLL